jgi:hypothetical protein
LSNVEELDNRGDKVGEELDDDLNFSCDKGVGGKVNADEKTSQDLDELENDELEILNNDPDASSQSDINLKNGRESESHNSIDVGGEAGGDCLEISDDLDSKTILDTDAETGAESGAEIDIDRGSEIGDEVDVGEDSGSDNLENFHHGGNASNTGGDGGGLGAR